MPKIEINGKQYDADILVDNATKYDNQTTCANCSARFSDPQDAEIHIKINHFHDNDQELANNIQLAVAKAGYKKESKNV